MPTATQPKPKQAEAQPRLRLVPPPPKLTAKQARDLAAADAKVAAAQAKLTAAKAEQEKVRDRLRPRLPSREEFVVGGYVVKRTAYSYESFSLKDFKQAGHKVTATMLKFVGTQHGEKWTIKRAKS